MSAQAPRTGFRFDMMPWKLEFCDLGATACRGKGELFYIDELPVPPEPGRVPESVDHLHIVQRYSGSSDRDVRDDEKWRALMKSVTRCEHGRLMRDACRRCPGGFAPDKTGTVIGRTQDGKVVAVPSFEDLNDIKAWIAD